MLWLIGAVAWAAATPAHSQSNIDAGKSAAQLFAASCNACHRSPREIRRTSASFLREHYTAGPAEAAAMAAYLASIGSDSKLIEQRRRPQLGAGHESREKAETQQAENKPRPRRPSESLDAGMPIVTAAPAREHAGTANFEE
jgi:hypothetical protein